MLMVVAAWSSSTPATTSSAWPTSWPTCPSNSWHACARTASCTSRPHRSHRASEAASPHGDRSSTSRTTAGPHRRTPPQSKPHATAGPWPAAGTDSNPCSPAARPGPTTPPEACTSSPERSSAWRSTTCPATARPPRVPLWWSRTDAGPDDVDRHWSGADFVASTPKPLNLPVHRNAARQDQDAQPAPGTSNRPRTTPSATRSKQTHRSPLGRGRQRKHQAERSSLVCRR